MQLLPRLPHDELATREDLAVTTQVLEAQMSELQAGLQTEMAQLASDLRTEMAQLAADLRTEMAELRSGVRRDVAGLQRWAAALVAANAVAMVTVLIA